MYKSFIASILHELADPQPNMNNVKLEHPAYYCNNYPEQGPVVGDRSSSVDAMVVSATYCEISVKFTCVQSLLFLMQFFSNTPKYYISVFQFSSKSKYIILSTQSRNDAPSTSKSSQIS